MEHLLVYLIEFVVWLDRRWQKPIRDFYPDLDALVDQPKVLLARQEIVIGPFRRWASSIGLGLALTVGLGVLWNLLELWMLGKVWGAARAEGELLIFWFGILLIAVVMISWMLRFLRGGEMILRVEGVEIRHKRYRIHCPWSLFNVRGNPFQPGEDRLLMPINSSSLSSVELHQDDVLKARGKKVKTRALRFKSPVMAMLNSIYEVKISDVGKLLLQLGRELSEAPPVDLTPPSEQPRPRERPPILSQSDGWLIASLNYLSFPEFCCDCGAQTTEKREFRAHSFLGESAKLEIPLCEECQYRFEQSQRRAVGRGIIYGVGVSMILVVLLSVLFPFWMMVVALSIPLVMMGFLTGASFGQQMGRLRNQPFEAKDYSPQEGVVSLRFRNSEYQEALILQMESEQKESRH